MERTKEQRPSAKWLDKAIFPLSLLLLSLAMSIFALYEERAPFYRPKPGELRFYSGIIQDVWHPGSRSHSHSSLDTYFRIEGASPKFLYTFDPTTHTLANGCLLFGSPVTVGVVPPSSSVWQLTCRGRTISDNGSTARRLREIRRRARNFAIISAIACGLIGAYRIGSIFLEGEGGQEGADL